MPFGKTLAIGRFIYESSLTLQIFTLTLNLKKMHIWSRSRQIFVVTTINELRKKDLFEKMLTIPHDLIIFEHILKNSKNFLELTFSSLAHLNFKCLILYRLRLSPHLIGFSRLKFTLFAYKNEHFWC